MFKHHTSLAGTFTSISGGILAMTIGTGAPVNSAQAIEAGTCYEVQTSSDSGVVTDIEESFHQDLRDEGQTLIVSAKQEIDNSEQERFFAFSSSPEGGTANLFIQMAYENKHMLCARAEGETTYANSEHDSDLKQDFGSLRREGSGKKQSPCDPAPGYFRESEEINKPEEPESENNDESPELEKIHLTTLCQSLNTYLDENSELLEPSLQMAYGENNQRLVTFNYQTGLFVPTMWQMLNTSPNGSTQSVTKDDKHLGGARVNYGIFQP